LQTAQTITPERDQQHPVTTAPRAESVAAPTQAERESRRRAGRRVMVIGGLAVVILGAALVGGTLPRLRQEKAVNTAAAQVAAAPPRVTVTVVRPAPPETDRVLPGNCLPLLEAAMYARTTGYLDKRLVDIGDHVKQGQLLA